jgi:hypothetical protein
VPRRWLIAHTVIVPAAAKAASTTEKTPESAVNLAN